MHDDQPTAAGDEGERPSVARVHDFVVGGAHHRRVDREFAAELVAAVPGIDEVIRELLTFRPRVVAHLASLGVDQYLDLGAGLPTVRPTHEVASRPGTRVLYVDNDPEVVAATEEILRGTPGSAVVAGDVGDAGAWLPGVADVLDLDRPVAVIASAVLHYADDGPARATLRALHAATVPGSWTAVAALSGSGRPEPVAWVQERHGGMSYPPRLREPEDMAPWFDGYDVTAPGWVAATHWDPAASTGPTPADVGSAYWGVLARRR